MDEPLKSLVTAASGVGLGQMLLFWVTRRSRRADSRDEKELNLETSLLAERRELLASLRAQLQAEQNRGTRLETEKATLLGEIFSLQKFANEVLAKYDFLRTLNPDALLPAVRFDTAKDAPGTETLPSTGKPPVASIPPAAPVATAKEASIESSALSADTAAALLLGLVLLPSAFCLLPSI